MWEIVGQFNIRVSRIPEGEEQENEAEKKNI